MANAFALISPAVGMGEHALPLVLFFVFASALLLVEAAERMGIPGILGGMLAGALIGPSALGPAHFDTVLHGRDDRRNRPNSAEIGIPQCAGRRICCF
jgi:hypothetical protein